MSNNHPKPIGELNGRWAMLFKVTQLLVPIVTIIVIPWGIWVVNSIHEHDMKLMRGEMNDVSMAHIADRVDALGVKIERFELTLETHIARGNRASISSPEPSGLASKNP